MHHKLKIFLPIETKSRELPYKAPLAFILADLGYEVIIGRQQELRLSWFRYKNFIYIDKSSARTKYKLFKDIKSCGGNIGVFCEEGLVYRSKQQYLSERLYSESFNLIDKFWCWGSKQYEDISEKFDKKKLKIIDSPRLSIVIKYKKSSAKIRNNRKKILFLTSFGRLNKKINNKKQTQLQILKKRGTYNKKIGEKFYLDWDKYLIEYQKSFIELISKCCIEFPNFLFEIRIHPSESKEKYLNIVKKFDNLDFSQTFELGEEIANSSYVISSYSTSSLESYFINKNSFVYNPISDERYEPEIIKKICICCKNPKDIISRIKSNKKEENFKERYKNLISFNGYDHFRILYEYAKEIISISGNNKNYRKTFFSFFIRFNYLLKHKLRNILYKFGIKKDTQNAFQKCSSISKNEIIKHGEEFLIDRNHFSNMDLNFVVKKLSNNVFEIRKL